MFYIIVSAHDACQGAADKRFELSGKQQIAMAIILCQLQKYSTDNLNRPVEFS